MQNNEGLSSIVFLDIEDTRRNLGELAMSLFVIGIIAIGFISLISLLVANRAIRPVEESMSRQRRFVAEVVGGAHGSHYLAVDDDLTGSVAGGLQKDGIHEDGRLYTRRLGLRHLGAAHFQTLPGDEAVERHILAFERRDAVAVLAEYPAQAGDQQALPCA